jgi:hypothetical protein
MVSNIKTIGALTGKFVPLIATGVPGGPEAGISDPSAAGTVTVKVAYAV